jgi:hypothetical protein
MQTFEVLEYVPQLKGLVGKGIYNEFSRYRALPAALLEAACRNP